MRAFKTITRDRGVTTIPVDLRQTAGVEPDPEITWVELAPELWLVGPASSHPEEVAPEVAAAVNLERSPFPTLMRRILAGELPVRAERGRRPVRRVESPPVLTEEQMVALGSAPKPKRYPRGRD